MPPTPSTVSRTAGNRPAEADRVDADPVGSGFRRARERWPAVAWGEPTYRRHVDWACGGRSSNLTDLFIAGAAGHRLDAAWEVVESDWGPPTRRILATQPTADYALEDLWADTLATLLEDHPDGEDPPPPPEAGADARPARAARIAGYRGRVQLLHYLVTIAKRKAVSRNRRRKPQLTLDRPMPGTATTPAETLPSPGAPAPDLDLLHREQADRLQAALTRAIATLTGEQRLLLALVVGRGAKQKEAGEVMGWTESHTSRQLARVRDALKAALSEFEDVAWDREMRDIWNRAWQAFCVDES